MNTVPDTAAMASRARRRARPWHRGSLPRMGLFRAAIYPLVRGVMSGGRVISLPALPRLAVRWRPTMRPAVDPLLRPFLDAREGAAAHTILGKLLVETADPIIRAVVGGKFRVHLDARRRATTSGGRRDENALDAEDTCADAHATLARRLHALRHAPPAEQTAIADFRGYVATVAYSAWVDYLRQRRPERARLLNQMRYLLEDHGRRRQPAGFALWPGAAEGERLCGFAAWREASAAVAPDARVGELMADPAAFVGDAIGLGELRTVNPARLLAVLFDRLGGPVRLEDLLEAVAQLWDVPPEGEAAADPDISADAAVNDLVSPLPDPHDAARWSEYLRWLWNAVGGLSVRQRAAFLLNSEVVKEFEHAGVASIRAVAGALETTPEDFAAFWSELPLSDHAIADRLGATRQQVINLRKAARIVLGRQLALLLADLPAGPAHE